MGCPRLTSRHEDDSKGMVPVAFFLVSGASQWLAQPNEADRKLLLTDIRAKAEHGDATAQFDLGNYCRTGVGVPKDALEAVKWFRRAAERGHAKGQCALGSSYANAVGVARDDDARANRQRFPLGS